MDKKRVPLELFPAGHILSSDDDATGADIPTAPDETAGDTAPFARPAPAPPPVPDDDPLDPDLEEASRAYWNNCDDPMGEWHGRNK
jgi:hypothetical protein